MKALAAPLACTFGLTVVLLVGYLVLVGESLGVGVYLAAPVAAGLGTLVCRRSLAVRQSSALAQAVHGVLISGTLAMLPIATVLLLWSGACSQGC
jgi:hypothetical protein